MSEKLVKTTIYYSIGEIVPRIISFLLLPILTKYLSADEYGIVSYTNSVMTFVFVIATLSLNTFVLRHYYSSKDEKSRRELIGSVFLFIFGFNCILILFQMLFFPMLIDFFNVNIPFKPYFQLAILNNFFDVISIIPLVLYRVKENAKGFLMLSLSRTLLQFLMVYILVVVYNQGLLGSYYARLVVNIPFMFIYFYMIYKNSIFRINFKLIKEALHFTLPILPGSLAFLFVSLSDRVILERYISLDQLGIFSVAITLATVLNIVIQALYKTFEPILFKEYFNENFQETNLKLYKIYLVAIFIGAFGASIFSKEFFIIATSGAFREGYKLVPLFIVSVVIAGINTYLNVLMIANKKQKMVSVVSIISAIISVVLNLIFIPFYGCYGAIIASAVSFLFSNVIFQYNTVIKKKYIITQFLLMLLVVIVPIIYDSLFDFKVLPNIAIKTFISLLFVALSFKILNIDLNFIKTKFFNKKINQI
ncbi:lipopolysaccharide biosynthesis protein [Flavobacterium sp. ov086]|uniref:lipopolysaccharide biosynthesis protein n=1 Tax=Flavobacterium sp. ov086 TaxID=1761785 RepID=UPI000B63FBBC|nr:oligosaccharide flippase family protein [Flavobacterium sp. ov086]SNR49499.1 Membrane protein involved in the export of O-antigen and teichoic acid [Flavobacterium sp. ov086]